MRKTSLKVLAFFMCWFSNVNLENRSKNIKVNI